MQLDRFIKGAVVSQFPDERPDDLEIQDDQTFRSPDVPGRLCFYVFNRAKNVLYGVVAQEQPDGTLMDYRAGIIPG